MAGAAGTAAGRQRAIVDAVAPPATENGTRSCCSAKVWRFAAGTLWGRLVGWSDRKQPEGAGPMPPRLAIDRQRIQAFCRKWGVRELAVFGSALREDFSPDSDVDVLVDLPEGHGLTLYDWLDMIEELKDIFGRDVDLVAKKALKNPFRRHEILRTAEVVYAS